MELPTSGVFAQVISRRRRGSRASTVAMTALSLKLERFRSLPLEPYIAA